MKKILLFIFLLTISLSYNTYASSGPIKQDSIIECNSKYYGSHGNPIHWHEVEEKDNKWVSVSGEVKIPSCYIKKVNEMEKVSFYKCSDGDTATFIINGEKKKVRFLAIDTPEVDKNELFSKEASEYTCNALKSAKEIYLEYDSNSDKEDKYGRVLAFIHVDGKLLEKELIERGYAKVAYIYGDYEHVEELKKEEEIARNKQIGIWQEIKLADTEVIESEVDNVDDNILLRIIDLIYSIIKMIFDLLLK